MLGAQASQSQPAAALKVLKGCRRFQVFYGEVSKNGFSFVARLG
jgi:hypothetical protein